MTQKRRVSYFRMTGALLESGLQPVDVAAETRPVPWEVAVLGGAKGYWDIINCFRPARVTGQGRSKWRQGLAPFFSPG